MTIYAGYGRFEPKLALDVPEKRAFAAQWLLDKRLERLRRKMPAEVFVAWAGSLEVLLEALEGLTDAV